MAAPTVFDTALETLDGKFTNDPRDRKRKGVKGEFLTAYAAVKLAYGVERDDHAIAYNGSSWPVLHDTLTRAFAALDEIAAESDERPVPFMLWCSRPRRSRDEVEAVLREAALRHPEMTVEEPAQLRPAPSGLLGVHKLRWVVCSQLALIAVGRSTTLGEVIQSILPIEETSDWALIGRLDRIIDDESIPWEKPEAIEACVPLSRAWGVKSKKDATYSFAQFLDEFRAEAALTPKDDAVFQEALGRFYDVHKKDETPDQGAPVFK